MGEQRRKEAIDYIMSCLEDGYIDLGLHDQDELEIVKEAMNMLKIVDKWNDIPEECWSDMVQDKLPPIPAVLFNKDSDGNYKHIAIIESINEDETITCIESNKSLNRRNNND